MSKIYLEIVNWPDGYGLTISDEAGNNCYAIAGTHGGGAGKTLKRFAINPDKLKEAIERVNYGIDSVVANRIISKPMKARCKIKEETSFEAIKNAEIKLVEIDHDGNQKTEAK